MKLSSFYCLAQNAVYRLSTLEMSVPDARYKYFSFQIAGMCRKQNNCSGCSVKRQATWVIFWKEGIRPQTSDSVLQCKHWIISNNCVFLVSTFLPLKLCCFGVCMILAFLSHSISLFPVICFKLLITQTPDNSNFFLFPWKVRVIESWL